MLFTDSLAPRAERSAVVAAIDAIAAGLRALPGDDRGANAAPGLAERALFFGYLHASLDGTSARADALSLLERAIDATASAPLRPGLFGGFTGVAFVSVHLHRLLDLGAPEVDAIDDVLARHVARARGGDFDLISGLVGFAVYALERGPSPASDAILDGVLAQLEARAERSGEALRIWTSPSLLRGDARTQFPSGRFDLGVAHGAAGIVAVLAHAALRDRMRARATALLRGVVLGLVRERIAAAERCAFPPHVAPGHRGVDYGRAAWCYGEPGVAMALTAAARALNDRALLAIARDVAAAVTARPDAAAHVGDAALCHGAMGLAHLYAHLAAAHDAPELAAYGRRWMATALASREPRGGIGGFVCDSGTRITKGPDGSLLGGAAGIGLALIAAVTARTPEWGRSMLVDPLVWQRLPGTP